MSSLASLSTLRNVRVSPSSSSEAAEFLGLLNRRRPAVSGISYSNLGRRQMWVLNSPAIVCKCMVATAEDLTYYEGISFSLESAYQVSSLSKDDDTNVVLTDAPKPALKGRTNGPANPLSSSVSSTKGIFIRKRPGTVYEDREKAIKSLGEVLNAEEPETANTAVNSVKLGRKEACVTAKSNSNSRPGRTPNAGNHGQKYRTSRRVWRRGKTVVSVPKVVKETPILNEGKEEQVKAPVVTEKKKLEPSFVNGSRTLKVMSLSPEAVPMQQAKEAVVSPSPHQTMSTRLLNAKERKPKLIDKYAQKKFIVDPIAVEAVIAPAKPVKGPPSSKFKEKRPKKSSATRGLRSRLAEEDDVDLTELDGLELDVRIPGMRSGRKWTKASRKAARIKAAKVSAPVKVEILEVGKEGMLVEELAFSLAISEIEILAYLYSKGIKPDAVHTLDKDMEMAKKKEMLNDEDLDFLELRPPIITIMGHVDHGKTTLLDYIRKSKVVASEAGGITQGIGAYKVQVPVDGKSHPCVFLDTPGHEAFGAMRARGARVTDITIIVVAADDGVCPQTNEAIAHSRAAGVPIVIAINKIDKEGSNPERVMQELSQAGLMPEEWGGDIPMVKISALKGDNVDELLETVMLVAELQELKANPYRTAKGTCIEAGLDKSRGPVSSLIVQNGTLRRGNIVVCGEAFGKVRALFDDRGTRVDEAGPSTAVQVIGLSKIPVAGDAFEVVDSLNVAHEKAEACAESLRVSRMYAKASDTKVTLSSLASAVSAGKQPGLDRHQLNIILKVDVQGSIEAIREAVQVLPQDNVTLKFLLQGMGDVSTGDIDLAFTTEAIVIGFNVKAPGSIKSYADKKNVEIRLYKVIYDLLGDMRNAMEGLLELAEEQIPIGIAEVRATFLCGSGRVAGCMVTEGKLVKGCGVCVVRNGKTVHTGAIDSLRRVKEDVKEVSAGLECGSGIDDFTVWEVGDVIKAFQTVKKKRTLEEAAASVAAALASAGFHR
ncbi:hypothetical protein HPP92_010815 [Vanilla planifolia]|uniref:Translation initiation factor IF-2, chloroplastic n=1 Tax=Vanilla planifolia TaxID=51239 RepID=A0A835R4V3_VANPL|nr:hypothetical protein HPP92_010815 [Vanilla planifolia]